MDSKSGIPALPYCQLNIQKRMHPEISLLLKKTLYPNLKDHPSTLLHPSVAGLSNRTYWLDHRNPENESAGPSDSSKSFSNTFEVDMVAGIVNYLVNSNVYGLSDIGVLVSLFHPKPPAPGGYIIVSKKLIFIDSLQRAACRDDEKTILL